MIVSIILILATLCCFMNHPLTLGFILLTQTVMIALLTGLMSLNFWSSYIIFLVMIGGMLVLFVYMTSIASNEKFKFSFKMFLCTTITMLLTFFMSLFIDKSLISQKFKMIETFSMYENMDSKFFLNKFINFPHNMMYLMMVIYLLITLIAVVKIASKTKGALRKNF
uniref:NADH-ubiquinone oxidoreductase chain 6 n=1 Tax=Cryptocephalus cantabricus TaxID=1091358 RepID=A0A3G1GRQ0_9CUCU|nr:NADH dehydrogenase subunit 6 [Cryptocephalus cantabricus]